MKKFIILCLAMCAMMSQAGDLTGKKIYVNPGHGGYDAANDRNIVTIPFAANDTLGFYESTCNLVKGLELRRLLQEAGATVMISRTLNRDQDDKVLSEIAEEANAFGADAFISVHSNALGSNNGTNYLLNLYKGNENAAAGVPWNETSKDMATKAWPYLYDNNITVWTSGTPANPIVRDDYHFLGYYLGVMRPLTVPGFLVEGSFHDYKPETHRLLNKDYAQMTAVNLYRFFLDYFEADAPQVGEIMGSIKDSQRVMNDPRFANYVKKTHDQYLPLNGAKATLLDAAGNELKSYTTDDFYNGVYVFRDLAPGNYKVRLEAEGYETQTKDVTVTAAKTTSFVTQLVDPNYEPPVITLGEPNIYASELSATMTEEAKYDLAFTLNADATSVTIKVMDGATVVKTIDAGALTKGKNVVQADLTGINKQNLTWSVLAVATPADDASPRALTNLDLQEQINFANLRGVAVDNSTESPYFGRLYMTEAKGGTANGRTTRNGLYVLDATFADVTGQGNNPYTGNITWASNASPNDVKVAEDGTLYLADWSDAHSGVWKADPADLTKDFTPIFAGARNADGLVSNNGVNVGGSVSSCWVEGSGENTVLYTIDEDMPSESASHLPLLRYDIGNADNPWTAAPSAVVYDNAPNPNDADGNGFLRNATCRIQPDANGNWWISQYRWSDTRDVPSLICVRDNQIIFNSAGMMGTSQKGAMAINVDGTLLAMGCADEIKVFDIGETADGTPTLTLKYSISPALGSESYGLAFDVADNVYLAAPTTGLGAWALPKQDNSFETPAPSTMTLSGKAGGVTGDVTGEGDVDVADVNAIINMMLGRIAHSSSGDVTGNGTIDVADVNAVINIMLGK
ncbi:MAG: N-acetylmuramoyl-L-alanine amidase [Muribaculaceae bacterium]|nr:N-acetylmuramoyl-L-alanine amidase [Muribaculaceae bacterium]